jgi:vancomycin resistance protein YoaR
MTDKPDEVPTPDGEELDQALPEPGVVVEDDELDLGRDASPRSEVKSPVDDPAEETDPEPVVKVEADPVADEETDPEPVLEPMAPESEPASEENARDLGEEPADEPYEVADAFDAEPAADESVAEAEPVTESVADEPVYEVHDLDDFSQELADPDGEIADGVDESTVPAYTDTNDVLGTAAAPAADEGPPPSEPDGDEPSYQRSRRVILGLVAVVAALYVAGYFLTGARMPANATVGGVDISGKSPSDARAAVDKALTPHVDDEIELSYGKKEFHVKPKDAGLAFDLDRTIDEAGGHRSWNPGVMAGLFFGNHPTDPALDVDNKKLQSVIGTIGEAVNEEVIEAQITFPNGKPKARQPKAGLVVARVDAAATIRKAYLVSDEPVKVPTAVVEPAVDSAGLARAMTTFAKPAVSGPVTIKVGDKKVSLPVTAYAPALVVRVEDNKLQPFIDPKKLAKPLTDSTTGIGKKAVDATVRIVANKPVVIPGKEGVGLQPAEMATKLIPALSKTGSARVVNITAKVVEPEFTTAEAKKLKITERISNFTTQFPYAEYRNINQSRAANIINGTILKPGETFSFNNTVGERTTANGFVNGFVINGGVFREELGGGVSQVATTTYNAGFFGGMDDVEHHPHAFYIDRYPVGREATVYYGSLDLRFKNPTKYGVLIRAFVIKGTPSSPGQMHVELWSTKVWDVKAGTSARRNFREPGTQYDDTDKCVPQDPIQGFDIDVYRTFYRNGVKVKGETDTATYQAADHVICGEKPKDE